MTLTKVWLEMSVEEDDGHGGKRRRSVAKDSGRGTPQGAPISPLLSMTALKLTVNEKKTRIARVPEESFDFLGYTIGRCYSVRTGRAFIGTRPSRKSTRVICAEIGAMTRSQSYRKPAAAVVEEIDRKLQGWGGGWGPVFGVSFVAPTPVYRTVYVTQPSYVTYARPTLARAQARLARLGYYPGPVEAAFGPMTSQALRSFQIDCGLPVTGRLNYRTRASLGV